MTRKNEGEKRGLYPKLSKDQIDWILKEPPNGECFGCAEKINPEGYEHGTRKKLRETRDAKAPKNKEKLWTIVLKNPTKLRGKKDDPNNWEKVCLSCLGDKETETHRVRLPPWTWRKIDRIAADTKRFKKEVQLNRSLIIRNIIIKGSSDYEPVSSFTPKFDVVYEVKVDDEQADQIAKRNLGELVEKGGEISDDFRKILEMSKSLVTSMEETIRNVEEMLPENTKDIFTEINRKTLHEASEDLARAMFSELNKPQEAEAKKKDGHDNLTDEELV